MIPQDKLKDKFPASQVYETQLLARHIGRSANKDHLTSVINVIFFNLFRIQYNKKGTFQKMFAFEYYITLKGTPCNTVHAFCCSTLFWLCFSFA